MAFRLIIDIRGTERLVNSDCIALLEPFDRDGWDSGAIVKMKQGLVERPATIDLGPEEGRDVRAWLESL